MSDYGHEQTDKELKRVENLISKEYAQAAEELEKKMMKHFSDFARKDAEKQKELKSGIITEQRYNEWKIGQLAIGQRWKDARDSMTNILVNADKNAAAIIQGNSIKAYGDNMNYGTYEVEHGSEINTGFTLYDEETVLNLLKEDPKLIPMPKVDIPKDELWNRQKLTSAVTQGILQGESVDKIAKRLGQVADMDKNAAIRNARTYTTAAENKGRLDSYERAEKLGIKTNKKWIATLDDRTRVEHRHLDNMVVAYDEDFEVDGYKISYPGDPSAEPEMIYNCRCTLVAEIANYDYKDERNDSKLGDMSYEEWKHAKDKDSEEKNANSISKVSSWGVSGKGGHSDEEVNSFLNLAGINNFSDSVRADIRDVRDGTKVKIRDSEKEVIIIAKPNEKEIYLDLISVENAGQGEGRDLFNEIIEQAKSQGYESITAYAAGDKDDEGYNGYYSLARFGFDGEIPEKLKEEAKEEFSANTIQDLMQTEEGRQWWRENGTGFEATYEIKNNETEVEEFSTIVDVFDINADDFKAISAEIEIPVIGETVKFDSSRDADEYFRGHTYKSTMGGINSARGYGVFEDDEKPATEWQNKLTGAQSRCILEYTGDTFEPINNFLTFTVVIMI